MDYYTFCELQPGDLVAVNRGRFEGRMFEVESVDYNEETARVVWSTAKVTLIYAVKDQRWFANTHLEHH